MYLINNIEVRKFISGTLLSPRQEIWFCCYECTIFTMGSSFRAASIQKQLLTKLDTIVKLRIF